MRRAMSLDRDKTRTGEQDLRWEAGNDKIITPAKVIRWMTSLRSGQTAAESSQAEFRPIVNVYESHLRVIAAIAYKF